ncbi:luciferase [Paenibacillus beijingensis]|uniref:Luciferase n=2 Tax=Paenibacillus beijingensis TaxID=1126833 RepID=A0A0D5NRH7_9BACL|nr:luciferase [Paenibacillus beijingensis]
MVPLLEGADAAEAIRQSVKLAQMAERCGFTRFWVSEHHDMPSLASSCPEVLLAYLGVHTSSLRIGSGAVLLPYYKPYKIAEAFHLLATLYPGRIDLGVGRAPGGSAQVSMALSANYLEGVFKLPDALRELSELLDGSFKVEGETVTARPVPRHAPELWMLGTSPKSAQLAAQLGIGYAFGQFMSDHDGREIVRRYRESFQPSARLKEPTAIVAVGAVCAPSEAEAAELAASMPVIGPAPVPGSARRSYAGAPARLAAELKGLADECSADELMLVTAIADYARRQRSLELLSAELLR